MAVCPAPSGGPGDEKGGVPGEDTCGLGPRGGVCAACRRQQMVGATGEGGGGGLASEGTHRVMLGDSTRGPMRA